MRLRGRISLITGGEQGIGRAIAVKFAEEGSEIAIFDVEDLGASRELEKLGRKAFFCRTDVSDSDSVANGVAKAISHFGKLDIVVNNAGITRDGLLLRMSESNWDEVVAVNLKGAFNIVKAVLRDMIKNGYGRIINISSVVGMDGNAGQANYAASKAGLIGFTKSLAKEVARKGITVNAVAPGFVKTRMTDVLKEDVTQRLLERIPVGSMGTPEDVASVALFLASSESRYVTGQVIRVDGGLAV